MQFAARGALEVPPPEKIDNLVHLILVHLALHNRVLAEQTRVMPLQRRFRKNFIVVRNPVANPLTPLDFRLGLMKNLLTQDLKHLSSNNEVSEPFASWRSVRTNRR